MQFSISIALLLAPIAIALPAPSENHFADRCAAPQPTTAAPETIPAYPATSVFVAPPTNPDITSYLGPAVLTTAARDEHGHGGSRNICRTGQVASCCQDGQGGSGILGGLLGGLLGGNCNLLDINLLGSQNNENVCGEQTFACCTADGNDIDRDGSCEPAGDF